MLLKLAVQIKFRNLFTLGQKIHPAPASEASSFHLRFTVGTFHSTHLLQVLLIYLVVLDFCRRHQKQLRLHNILFKFLHGHGIYKSVRCPFVGHKLCIKIQFSLCIAVFASSYTVSMVPMAPKHERVPNSYI